MRVTKPGTLIYCANQWIATGWEMDAEGRSFSSSEEADFAVLQAAIAWLAQNAPKRQIPLHTPSGNTLQ